MTWRPLHPQHAIERTRVTISFEQAVPEKLSTRAASIFEERAAALQFGGRIQTQTAIVSLAVGGAGSPPKPEIVPVLGWTFNRNLEDTGTIEAFGLNGADLFYEVAEYGRWAFLRQRLEAVFGQVPAFLSQSLSHRVTTLEYQDRFVYFGAPEKADVRDLIVDIASAIPPRAASGEKMWHLHRSWVHEQSSRDIIVQQNLDPQDGALQDGTPARSLLITTRAVLRYDPGQEGIEPLYQELDLLHDVANGAFSAAIRSDFRTMVGLGAE